MNSTPTLLLGIDEFTITMIPNKKIFNIDWKATAENQINNVVKISDIEEIMNGSLQEMDSSKPQGYSKAYNLGIKDYYIAFAYHENLPEMGICIRFSAKSWSIYQYQFLKKYQKKILLPKFIKKIALTSNEFTVRFTRIDLTADFYNYGLSLNDLYNKIKNTAIIIQNENGKSPIKSISFYGKNSDVETIYIGSRKTNSKGFLRIYNKKKEQIDTNGFRLEEALSTQDWVRFEAVFKGKYAHNISDIMISTSMNEKELSAFIAKLITQKYRLYDNNANDYLKATTDLLEIASSSMCDALRSESPRDNSLHQSISHLRCGSGFYPTLYKIEKLYGIGKLEKFLKDLYMEFRDRTWITPSVQKELNMWMNKHADLIPEHLEENY